MYEPRRTARYEYVTELMDDVETELCINCVFREPGGYPMCVDIAGYAVLGYAIPEWDEDEFGKVVCTKYEYATPSHVRQEEQWDQDTLGLA